MSEISITPKIIKQTELVRKECLKLQELLDDEMLDKTFIWYADELEVNIIPDMFRKNKRTREENVPNEDNEDDEDDVEVKPNHKVMFKVDGSQSLHRLYLSHKLS
jgi:hypothetical protein